MELSLDNRSCGLESGVLHFVSVGGADLESVK